MQMRGTVLDTPICSRPSAIKIESPDFKTTGLVFSITYDICPSMHIIKVSPISSCGPKPSDAPKEQNN